MSTLRLLWFVCLVILTAFLLVVAWSVHWWFLLVIAGITSYQIHREAQRGKPVNKSPRLKNHRPARP